MFFRVCRSKNAGVAGYAEAFWPVQSGKQASYLVQLFSRRCTSKYHRQPGLCARLSQKRAADRGFFPELQLFFSFDGKALPAFRELFC